MAWYSSFYLVGGDFTARKGTEFEEIISYGTSYNISLYLFVTCPLFAEECSGPVIQLSQNMGYLRIPAADAWMLCTAE